MYVELLSSAPVGKLDELTGDTLVSYIRACRADMMATGSNVGSAASSSLVAKLVYDRALLKICAVNDIDVCALDFSHPAQVRRRLERELKNVGIDVAAPFECFVQSGSQQQDATTEKN